MKFWFGFSSNLSLRPDEEESASWKNVIDFRLAKVKKEDFNRDIPAEISEEWSAVQESVLPKDGGKVKN